MLTSPLLRPDHARQVFGYQIAMPRATKPSGKARHDPLHVQLGEDEVQAKYGKVTRPGKRRKSSADNDEEDPSEVRGLWFTITLGV